MFHSDNIVIMQSINELRIEFASEYNIMLQKIIKVGNSVAITLPKSFLTDLQFPSDGTVRITQDLRKRRIFVDFSQEELTEDIVDKEVYGVAKQLLKRYLPAFKELSKR